MLTRRVFLTRSLSAAAATAVPLGLVGCGSGSSASGSSTGASRPVSLTASITGNTVARQQVLEWEARRLQVVVQRMSNNLPGALIGDLVATLLRPAVDTSSLAVEREALADAKIRAGDRAMTALVAVDLAVSTPASELAARVPGYAVSEIDLFSDRGTAEGFADWFKDKIAADDQRAMLVACPDHYVLRAPSDHSQDVIETTGGAIFASHFVIDYLNPGTLPLVIDPAFPVRFSGTAVNENGTVIGGTNHRLRTLPTGFQIHAAIFFPAVLPPTFISEHRWHLACEFSNWIEAYIAETGD